jgi:hypothetical protein
MNDYRRYKVQFITYSAFVFECVVDSVGWTDIFAKATDKLNDYCRMTMRDPNDFHLHFVMEIPK